MKIAYLSTSIFPSQYANSIQVQHMCDAFVALENDVTLFATMNRLCKNVSYQKFSSCKFKIKYVNRIGPWPLSSLWYGFSVGRNVSPLAFDLAYARCPHSVFYAGLRGVPFIYEAHDLPKRGFRCLLEGLLFRMPTFRKLVTITNALRIDYLKNFPTLSEDKIIVAHDGAVIPNIADVDKYCLQDVSSTDNMLNIGYFGSLYPGKGIEVIIELAKIRPRHRYHIYGGTDEIIKIWKGKAPKSITFHGWIDHEKVSLIARSMNILLLPNQPQVQTAGGGDIGKYTSPLKMFEYMAAGRPIIASQLPVLQEVLEDKKHALIVAADNFEAWATALDQLLFNKNLRHQLSINAFNLLKLQYTWDKRAVFILEMLKHKKNAFLYKNVYE